MFTVLFDKGNPVRVSQVFVKTQNSKKKFQNSKLIFRIFKKNMRNSLRIFDSIFFRELNSQKQSFHFYGNKICIFHIGFSKNNYEIEIG